GATPSSIHRRIWGRKRTYDLAIWALNRPPRGVRGGCVRAVYSQSSTGTNQKQDGADQNEIPVSFPARGKNFPARAAKNPCSRHGNSVVTHGDTRKNYLDTKAVSAIFPASRELRRLGHRVEIVE